MSEQRGQSASIDDLLGGSAAEEAPRGDRSRAAPYLKGLVATGLLSIVAFAALGIAKLSAPLWFVVLVCAALVAVFSSIRRVRPPLPSRAAGRRHLPDTPPDGLRHTVKRWEARLEWCHADASAFNRKIVPALAEIVDERLRQRHGITRSSDPQRARALVGEPLWNFLSAPVRRPPGPRELANLIAWMERI